MKDSAGVVQAVLAAEQRTRDWDAGTWMEVLHAAPDCLQQVTSDVWCVTVETFRTDGEPLLVAAKRLALYLDLHAEVSGRPPRLSAVQHQATKRNAQEGR